MKMKIVIVLAALLAAAGARAQTASQLPGEPSDASSAAAMDSLAKPEVDGAPARPLAPVARAVELAFGATTWAVVRVSTAGAAADLSRYSSQGFYKRELIELVLMSAEARRQLSVAVEKRKQGARLADIALEYNVDYGRIVERALAIEDVVDRVYLPMFPERRPRKEREE